MERREGLKVPQRQPKRARLWLNDGSCIRLKPERPNHVWAYDFVEDRTHDGSKIRMLNVGDEFTREALAIRVARRLNSSDVIDVLSDLLILRGVPAYIQSDNVLCRERKSVIRRSISIASLTSLSSARQHKNQAASTTQGMVLYHSKHEVLGTSMQGPNRPQNEMPIQVEDPNIIYRVAVAPSRPLQRGVLPPGTAPSKKGR